MAMAMAEPAEKCGKSLWKEVEIDCSGLLATTVRQLIECKERKQVIEVPYTASVSETMRTMHRYQISAVPIAAPSCTNRIVGAAMKTALPHCKHYIGIVSNLDILMHMAELNGKNDDVRAPWLLNRPVHTIISRSVEGSNLQIMKPDTSVLEAIDMLSRGVCGALVPLEVTPHANCTNGMAPESCSSCYGMLTRTDVVRFLRSQSHKLHPLLSRSVDLLGAVNCDVLGVSGRMPFCDTLKCMRQSSLTAVALLELTEEEIKLSGLLQRANGKWFAGTFSASDLNACPEEALKRWSGDSVLQFIKRLNVAVKHRILDEVLESEEIKFQADWIGSFCWLDSVVCDKEDSLEDVMSMALDNKVHRVWVLEQNCLVRGLISLMDILRVVRCYCPRCHWFVNCNSE